MNVFKSGWHKEIVPLHKVLEGVDSVHACIGSERFHPLVVVCLHMNMIIDLPLTAAPMIVIV